MRKTAVLFSGQGAQSPGMGRDIYRESAAARGVFDLCEELLPGLRELCFDGDAGELSLTENAQPALFAAGLAFAEALKERGAVFDAAAGFSLGEIPALAFSGVLSVRDAFRLVCERSRKMAELSRSRPGGMVAALKLDDAAVERIAAEFREVWPVNYNCPGQLVCAGSADELAAFTERVRAEGGRAAKLAVSGAFHSPYMAEAEGTLRGALAGMEISPPALPLYANLTGDKYPSTREGIIDTVARQVRSPVRWERILRNMAAEGIDTFVEVGAGATLTGFVRRTLPGATALTVTDLAGFSAAARALTEGA